MKKLAKSIVALGLAGLIALTPKMASAESKLLKILKNFEVSASYGMQFNDKNPAQAYIDSVNKDFRDGKYTFKTPITDWQAIIIDNPIESPIEVAVLYKISKGTKIGIMGGNSSSKVESNYNKDYVLNDGTGDVSFSFKRKEEINSKNNSFGFKINQDLKNWLTLSVAYKIINYETEGKVDYTMKRLNNNYQQWRKANFSGSGQGNVIEGGLEFNITKNISISTCYSQRVGEVKTSGKEERGDTSNVGKTLSKDYSPVFDYNSSSTKFNINLKI